MKSIKKLNNDKPHVFLPSDVIRVMENVEIIHLNEFMMFLEKNEVRSGKEDLKLALRAVMEKEEVMQEGEFFRKLFYHLGRDIDIKTCREIQREFVKRFSGH